MVGTALMALLLSLQALEEALSSQATAPAASAFVSTAEPGGGMHRHELLTQNELLKQQVFGGAPSSCLHPWEIPTVSGQHHQDTERGSCPHREAVQALRWGAIRGCIGTEGTCFPPQSGLAVVPTVSICSSLPGEGLRGGLPAGAERPGEDE